MNLDRLPLPLGTAQTSIACGGLIDVSDSNLAITDGDVIEAERRRVLAEYDRRKRESDPDRYAPWDAAELLFLSERKRIAAEMLYRAGVFPGTCNQCLEIGFGRLGWLSDLISWGVPERNLSGIELNKDRLMLARGVLPNADLRGGDACELPWPPDAFSLVIVSTVFSSILDIRVRRKIAEEIKRVLSPGGALLWYDFAVNNPQNGHVRKVEKKELVRLFEPLRGEVQRVTLLPPLARLLAPRSWVLATICSAVPPLRTHLLAVLVKRA